MKNKPFHIIYGWFWKPQKQDKADGFRALGVYWERYCWGEKGALVVPEELRDLILDKYNEQENGQKALEYFRGNSLPDY